MSSEAADAAAAALDAFADDRIRVYCRIRKDADSRGASVAARDDGASIDVANPLPGAPKAYGFDGALGPNVTQASVFEAVGRPLTEAVLQGFHGTILAYGQTGSGKTYTTFGPAELLAGPDASSDSADRGLVPRVLGHLFERMRALEAAADHPVSFRVAASFYEIFQERVFDLLAGASLSPGRSDPAPCDTAGLSVREERGRGVFVEHLSSFDIGAPEEAMRLLRHGYAQRRVAETAMNRASSRSHALFTLTLTCEESSTAATKRRVSRFNLVDLAGSERQKQSLTVGDRLKEASAINQSLSMLGNVINALTSAGTAAHVPYRNSKLTFLLRDSLGGNSKTALVATLSPAVGNLTETQSTLKFAARAAKVCNRAIVNEDTSANAAALQAQLHAAQEELAQLRALVSDPVAARGAGPLAPGAPGAAPTWASEDDELSLLVDALRRAAAAEAALAGLREAHASLAANYADADRANRQLTLAEGFRQRQRLRLRETGDAAGEAAGEASTQEVPASNTPRAPRDWTEDEAALAKMELMHSQLQRLRRVAGLYKQRFSALQGVFRSVVPDADTASESDSSASTDGALQRDTEDSAAERPSGLEGDADALELRKNAWSDAASALDDLHALFPTWSPRDEEGFAAALHRRAEVLEANLRAAADGHTVSELQARVAELRADRDTTHAAFLHEQVQGRTATKDADQLRAELCDATATLEASVSDLETVSSRLDDVTAARDAVVQERDEVAASLTKVEQALQEEAAAHAAADAAALEQATELKAAGIREAELQQEVQKRDLAMAETTAQVRKELTVMRAKYEAAKLELAKARRADKKSARSLVFAGAAMEASAGLAARQGSELGAVRAERDSLHARVDEQGRQLVDRSAALTTASERVDELEAATATKDLEISANASALAEALARVQLLEAANDAKDEALREAQDATASAVQRVAQLSEQAKLQATELDTRAASLEEMSTIATRLGAEATEKDAELAVRQGRLDEAQSRVETLESEVNAKDAELEAQACDVADAAQRIEALEETMAEKDAELQERQSRLTAAAERIDALEVQATELEGELGEKSRRLATAQEKLESQAFRLTTMTAEAKAQAEAQEKLATRIRDRETTILVHEEEAEMHLIEISRLTERLARTSARAEGLEADAKASETASMDTEAEVAVLHAEKTRLMEDAEIMATKLARSKASASTMATELEDGAKSLAHLQQTLEWERRAGLELRNQKEALEAAAEKAELQMQQLERDVALKMEEARSSEAQALEAVAEGKKLAKQLKAAEKKATAAHGKLEKARGDLASQAEEIEAASNTLAETREALTEATTAAEEALVGRRSADDEVEALEKTVRELAAEVESLSEREACALKAGTDLDKQLRKAEKRASSAAEAAEAARAKLAAKEEDLREIADELSTARTALEAAEEGCLSLESVADEGRAAKAAAEDKVAAAQANAAALQEALARLEEEVAELRVRNAALDEEVARERAQGSAAQSAMSSLRRGVRSRVTDLEKAKAKYEAKMGEENQAAARYQVEAAELRKELETANSTLREIETLTASQDSTVESLRSDMAAMAGHSNAKQKIRALMRLKTDLAGAQTQLRDLRAENARLRTASAGGRARGKENAAGGVLPDKEGRKERSVVEAGVVATDLVENVETVASRLRQRRRRARPGLGDLTNHLS